MRYSRKCGNGKSTRDPVYPVVFFDARKVKIRDKVVKTRGSFPNDDATLKLLYLVIKNAGLRRRRAIVRTTAIGQFAIQFGERFPGTARS